MNITDYLLNKYKKRAEWGEKYSYGDILIENSMDDSVIVS